MKKMVKSLTKKDWITAAVRILAFGSMLSYQIKHLNIQI